MLPRGVQHGKTLRLLVVHQRLRQSPGADPPGRTLRDFWRFGEMEREFGKNKKREAKKMDLDY